MSIVSRLKNGVVIAVIAILALSALVVLRASDHKTYTAYFSEAKGVYVGDDVTVLSVPVGTITEITAERERVKVTMQIDSDQKLPADAKAAIVSKSLVSVRSIVIGPVYTGGPALTSDSPIPLSRTTVPVEWDQVKDELVRLTDALGPKGANSNGATSDLINATATYLDGRGSDINQTIKDLSTASTTLSDNKNDLFATVRNLEVFVTALKSSDAQVRAFETQLARASDVLDANKGALSDAIVQFKGLTQDTAKFFSDNKDSLADTLTSIETTTSVLSENRQSIADLLQGAPTAISNFYNIHDPRAPAITGELALSNFGDPAYLICGGLFALGGSTDDCRTALGPLVNFLKISAPPIGANPLTGNGVGPDLIGTPESEDILGARSQASAPSAPAAPAETASGDADILSQLSSMLGGTS